MAVASGFIHNRLRDWDSDGNHPGYVLGCWPREHADQVWLFTTRFEVLAQPADPRQMVPHPRPARSAPHQQALPLDLGVPESGALLVVPVDPFLHRVDVHERQHVLGGQQRRPAGQLRA